MILDKGERAESFFDPPSPLSKVDKRVLLKSEILMKSSVCVRVRFWGGTTNYGGDVPEAETCRSPPVSPAGAPSRADRIDLRLEGPPAYFSA